jgi:hypothetical protein
LPVRGGSLYSASRQPKARGFPRLFH